VTDQPGSGPSPGELWEQAHGDADLYHDLMREHGYLVTCECACHAGGSGHCERCRPVLPCGWPGKGNVMTPRDALAAEVYRALAFRRGAGEEDSCADVAAIDAGVSAILAAADAYVAAELNELADALEQRAPRPGRAVSQVLRGVTERRGDSAASASFLAAAVTLARQRASEVTEQAAVTP
jgi:hypothetical protein